MNEAREALIVAMDGTAEQAREWAQDCRESAGWAKVGMTLFYAQGPSIVEELSRLGYRVFLDLKLHDIPHQVENAAFVLGSLGIGMFTVHAAGGTEMMKAAKRGARAGAAATSHQTPLMLAVTVLTSSDARTLQQCGVEDTVLDQVRRLAVLAKESGADGIVCSPHEAARVRELIGTDMAIVTPGVRPKDAESDDQSRIMSPAEAIEAGATHLVVGRPITKADDPKIAAQRIYAEIARVQEGRS
jgi:orotidine-5'-phosphate decarboxylase